jgi:sulfate adenylyltransferase
MDTSHDLPAGLGELSSVHVDGRSLDLIELSLAGLVGSAGFSGPAEFETAVLPVPLAVPAELVAAVRLAGRAVLRDAEGVPVAVVEVTELWQDPQANWLAAGTITAAKALTHGVFRKLRLSPAQVNRQMGGPAAVVIATATPLTQDTAARVADKSGGQPVLVLGLVGTGRSPYPGPVGLVQALLAALPDLPAGSLVVPVPVPRLTDPARDVLLVDAVAAAFGASEVICPPDTEPAVLDRVVADSELFAPAVLQVLRRHRPPPSERGVVLLFTGLSGSGKSTVAKGVEDALVERGGRTLTFLDGDVVRRNLSKGLGFSRADRDLNVRRIGFVAAEVARHGGIAICAPIAPYAATRAAVRTMVTEAGGVFLLVYVATPIEVCEARDRKGLYALARAGTIPEFTGVSDPYEVPEDADLRLDTSVQTADEAVDAVLGMLTAGGFLPAAMREDG